MKGDKEAVAQLRVDDEFVRAIIGVQLVHSNVGVVGAYADEALQSVLTMWDEEEKIP